MMKRIDSMVARLEKLKAARERQVNVVARTELKIILLEDRIREFYQKKGVPC